MPIHKSRSALKADVKVSYWCLKKFDIHTNKPWNSSQSLQQYGNYAAGKTSTSMVNVSNKKLPAVSLLLLAPCTTTYGNRRAAKSAPIKVTINSCICIYLYLYLWRLSMVMVLQKGRQSRWQGCEAMHALSGHNWQFCRQFHFNVVNCLVSNLVLF